MIPEILNFKPHLHDAGIMRLSISSKTTPGEQSMCTKTLPEDKIRGQRPRDIKVENSDTI